MLVKVSGVVMCVCCGDGVGVVKGDLFDLMSESSSVSEFGSRFELLKSVVSVGI